MKSSSCRGISYDERHLPLQIIMDGGLNALYRYGGDGQRLLKELVHNGATISEHWYIMDGPQLLGVADEGGNMQFWNMYGQGLYGRQMSDRAKRYYLQDHLGSTRRVVDQSGNNVDYYDYYRI